MNTQVKEILLQSLQAEIGYLRRASANGMGSETEALDDLGAYAPQPLPVPRDPRQFAD